MPPGKAKSDKRKSLTTQTIPLKNDHSRTSLSNMKLQQQYNNHDTEHRSDHDAKTGAKQLFFVENIPYNHPFAHFLGLLRHLQALD
jgi:hypothetical protein